MAAFGLVCVSDVPARESAAGGLPRARGASGAAAVGRTAFVTAPALVMSISFAALIAAQVSFMRMFGVGLTLAVLVDATLVRMILVPAFMGILGRWNWWAPASLVRLHQRVGTGESAAPRS